MVWSFAAALLVLLTLLLRAWPVALTWWLAPVDLGHESNIAAWFSASSLLWSGLLMWSSAVWLVRQDRWASAAAFVLGGAAFVLCLDEAGSLHERVGQVFPDSFKFYLNVLFAALVLPAVGSIAVLFWRRSSLGNQWALLLAAYALFGSVFAQEMLEHAVAWPGWALPIRTAIEEGTELVGFFLLLLAGLRLNRHSQAAASSVGQGVSCPCILPVWAALVLAFVVAALCAPLLILTALSIPVTDLQLYRRGDFGSTMMLAMFLIAGVACLGKSYAEGDGRAWRLVGFVFFLLSLLQNWNAYTDAYARVTGRDAERLWRACYDLVWALPILLAVLLVVRQRVEVAWWMFAGLAVLWLVCVFSAWRGSFRLSYGASYLTALSLGAWVFYATWPGRGVQAVTPLVAGGAGPAQKKPPIV
ncbi:MAG: hypothetical protein ACIAXF_06335 [Phycisphaerales bacterium JB063]